jgi:heme-degrading monooxygenase HmoA
MLVRIWRTRIDATRAAEYETFAEQRSRPMFKRQEGFEGVVFARSGADCAVITFWRDASALEALAGSRSYCETVEALGATGILTGEAVVEVLGVQGGSSPLRA